VDIAAKIYATMENVNATKTLKFLADVVDKKSRPLVEDKPYA
jgi:hypothetical protein